MGINVLLVCTGNICRSPFAEIALREETKHKANLNIQSAGTHALDGFPMEDITRRTAEKFGYYGGENHRARSVSKSDIRRADLVLTMDQTHRSRVLRVHPAALRKVFTYREFCRLAEFSLSSDDNSLTSVGSNIVDVFSSLRGKHPTGDSALLDIPDPYRGSKEIRNRATELLVGASRGIAKFMDLYLPED